jgi:hypothetical protein
METLLECHAGDGGHPLISGARIVLIVHPSGPMITGSSAFSDDDSGV